MLLNRGTSIPELCPVCRTPRVLAPTIDLASKEWVCTSCGAATADVNPYAGAEAYGRSPQSHLVYGGGLGTNIATRNPDGTSDDFALKGDNGKYTGVIVALRGWDLVSTIEPDYRVRMMKERLASHAVRPDEESGLAKDSPLDLLEPAQAVAELVKRGRVRNTGGRRRRKVDEIKISNDAAHIMRQIREQIKRESLGLVEKEAVSSKEMWSIKNSAVFGGDKSIDLLLNAVINSAIGV